LSFIIIGGLFYNYEDEYGWNKGLYYAVNGIIAIIIAIAIIIIIIIISWF